MDIQLSDGSTWSLAAVSDLLARRCGGGVHNLQLLSNGQSTILSGTQISSGLQVIVKLTITPGTAKSEAYFLAEWRRKGVPVPNIILMDDASRNHEPDILVMERIDGVPLTNSRPISADMVKRIAQLQSLMHLTAGKGYGRPVKNTPWHGVANTFSDEMEIEWEQRLAQLAQHRIFPGDLRSKFVFATTFIETHCNSNNTSNASTLTHSDLSMNNIILNKNGALVIIDPNCRLTHPAMCAAYTFLRLSLEEGPNIAQIYKNYYLSYSGICDSAFDAALKLRAMLSISTWLKKEKFSEAVSAVSIAGLV